MGSLDSRRSSGFHARCYAVCNKPKVDGVDLDVGWRIIRLRCDSGHLYQEKSRTGTAMDMRGSHYLERAL